LLNGKTGFARFVLGKLFYIELLPCLCNRNRLSDILSTNAARFSYFLRNPERLGGPGKVIEVDETCISRRKYNVGRLIVEQQWFVTGKP
jgi:hypothetical protein